MKLPNCMLVIFFTFGYLPLAHSEECANVKDEPVSVCRAEQACGKGSFGHAAGSFFGAFGSGFNGQKNQAEDNYNACIDRDLSVQRANAELKKDVERAEASSGRPTSQ